MNVRATRQGYYGNKLRREGEVFTLVDAEGPDGKTISASAQFSERWMEEADESPKNKKKGQPKQTSRSEQEPAVQPKGTATTPNQEVI